MIAEINMILNRRNDKIQCSEKSLKLR